MSNETPEFNYNEEGKPDHGHVTKDFDSLGQFDDSGNRGKRDLKRAPLGPDSLLWRWGSDNRIQLLRGYTGVLQNMHHSCRHRKTAQSTIWPLHPSCASSCRSKRLK